MTYRPSPITIFLVNMGALVSAWLLMQHSLENTEPVTLWFWFAVITSWMFAWYGVDMLANYQIKKRFLERVLSLLISGGLQDERFDGLYVDSVKPEPDMSCLMVTVMPVLSDTIPDPDSIKLFLESVKGCLRNEVALEIRRKRMPDFKFRVKIDQDQFNQ